MSEKEKRDSQPVATGTNWTVVIHTSSPRKDSGSIEFQYPKMILSEGASLDDAMEALNAMREQSPNVNDRPIPELRAILQEGINRVVGLALDPNSRAVGSAFPGYGTFKRTLEPLVKAQYAALTTGDTDAQEKAAEQIKTLRAQDDNEALFQEYVRRMQQS